MKQLLTSWLTLLENNEVALVIEDIKKCLIDIPAVAYICDTKLCENGSCQYGGECHHTFDINHAVNFKKLTNNKYVEDDKLDLILKEIRGIKNE